MAPRTSAATGANTDPNNIRVISRFRPLNNLERRERDGGLCVSFMEGETVQIKYNEEQGVTTSKFQFDKVFGMESSQDQIFEVTGAPVVKAVFEGYNGTIFAYGQTGSGKSYTMMGPSDTKLPGFCAQEELKGIIPRVVDQIFAMVHESEEHLEFTIKVGYVEIYMEKIRDLFEPERENLKLHEDLRSGKGVYVADAVEHYVTCASEVFELMKKGAANRSVAATRMNVESSRSHSIFCITLTQKDSLNHEQRTGKLYLVDLAGSEKVGKTMAQGQQLEEAKLINKSLSTLGKVIYSLTDRKSTHVPYRDSKLTRLLTDSLGGNSRTTLIVCCSPAKYNDLETLSTSRFGERAKKIRNKAKINREMTVQELQILLARAEQEIVSLKRMKGVALGDEEAKRAEDAEMQRECERFTEEKEELQDQLAEALQRIHHQELKAASQEAQIKCLRETEEIWEQEYDALFQSSKEAVRRAEQLDGELGQKQAAIDRLVQACEVSAEEIRSAKQQPRKLRAALEQHLGAMAEKSAVQQEELRRENARLLRELEEVGRRVTNSQEGSVVMRESMTNEQHEELMGEMRSKFETMIDTKLELDNLREAYADLEANSGMKSSMQEVGQLRQERDDLHNMLNETMGQLTDLKMSMELAEKKLSIRNERIENLKATTRDDKKAAKEAQDRHLMDKEKWTRQANRLRDELAYWKEKARKREQQRPSVRTYQNVVPVLRGGVRLPDPTSPVMSPASSRGENWDD